MGLNFGGIVLDKMPIYFKFNLISEILIQ